MSEAARSIGIVRSVVDLMLAPFAVVPLLTWASMSINALAWWRNWVLQ